MGDPLQRGLWSDITPSALRAGTLSKFPPNLERYKIMDGKQEGFIARFAAPNTELERPALVSRQLNLIRCAINESSGFAAGCKGGRRGLKELRDRAGRLFELAMKDEPDESVFESVLKLFRDFQLNCADRFHSESIYRGSVLALTTSDAPNTTNNCSLRISRPSTSSLAEFHHTLKPMLDDYDIQWNCSRAASRGSD